MFIKVYKKNEYIELNINDFSNKSFFYKELLNIRLNLKQPTKDPIKLIDDKVKNMYNK